MSAKEKWEAPGVIARLRKKQFASPAHVLLTEVRNRTGYGKAERYADALVASVWPSRGLWLAGVEVKVSRSDWQSELKNPEKAAEIQQYCDYWWVAVPRGIVKDGELPENWGLIEVHGKAGCDVVKPAPRLEPKPLALPFIMSILRSVAKGQEAIAGAAMQAAHAEHAEERAKFYAQEEREFDHKRVVSRLEREVELAKSDKARTMETLRRYEEATGIPPHELSSLRWTGERVKACYQLAQTIQSENGVLNSVTWALETAKEALEKVKAAGTEAAK